MAYYEPQGWQAPMRQTSWEQPPPPSRSGASSAVPRDESNAFAAQFDEVDRAVDNLVKSGKMFNGLPRRESLPMTMGRPYDYDPRVGGAGTPQRHHSISNYDEMRPQSASNMQSFYASQRFPSRSNEAEQMMQAKRRMAAQRERELRNYHQEQQYHRSLLAEIPGNKSERSMSPAMNEENRRELIARQHRALYGNDGQAFSPDGGIGDDNQRADNHPSAGTPTTMTSGGRGPSPRGVDPFGLGAAAAPQAGPDITAQANPGQATGPSPVVQQQPRSPSVSASSPGSGANATSYGVLDANPPQKPSHTSTSPNPDSPSSLQGISKTPGASVGPIGSRPTPQSAASQAPNPSLSRRSTTPLPSPLSYGFSSNEVGASNTTSNNNNNELPISNINASNQANNPPTTTSGNESSPGVGLGWAGGNNVWKSKNPLGVQASVWG